MPTQTPKLCMIRIRASDVSRLRQNKTLPREPDYSIVSRILDERTKSWDEDFVIEPGPEQDVGRSD